MTRKKKARKSREQKLYESHCKSNVGPVDPSLNTSLYDIKTLGYSCSNISLVKCLKEVKKPHPRRLLEMIQLLQKMDKPTNTFWGIKNSNSHNINSAYEIQKKKDREIKDGLIKEIMEAIVERDKDK